MKRNIKRFTVKLTSALLLAATLMGTAATAVRADEMDTQPTECVETVVEGQGDVIDDCFAVVEGQGDIIDDCFAVAPEEAQPVEETVVEEQPVAEVEGQGDIIDDCFAVAPEEAQPVEETVVETPVAEAADNTTNDLAGAGALDATALTEASLNAVGGWSLFGLFGNDEKSDLQKTVDVITPINVNNMDEVYRRNEEEEAKKAAEAEEERIKKQIHDSAAAMTCGKDTQFQDILDSKDKSNTTKTIEVVNKLANPSDTNVAEPLRKAIDDNDSLDEADKEYLKKLVSIVVNTSEGYGLNQAVPGAGSVRKGAKALEELSKANDAKTTEDLISHVLNAAENAMEGGVGLLPGGGLMVSAAKTMSATRRYIRDKFSSNLSEEVRNRTICL